MRNCPKCSNIVLEVAISCPHCGTVLDSSVIPRGAGERRGRTETVVESSTNLRPTPPSSEYRPSPPPQPAAEYRPGPPPHLATEYRPSPPPALPGAAQTPGSIPARRGQTLYAPPSTGLPKADPSTGAATGVQAPRLADRRVVGVLVTYSWKPEGQVFPIREGRNLIGRGPECEIRVEDDSMLSQVNSHITFRQNFMLGDMVSMSGTYLSDQPVEDQFRRLSNYAQIRTGSTNWTFVVVDPALITQES